MKLIKIIIMITVIGGIILLSACSDEKLKNNEPVFDNENTFTYDEKSELTINSFDGIATMTEMNIKYPFQKFGKTMANTTLYIA